MARVLCRCVFVCGADERYYQLLNGVEKLFVLLAGISIADPWISIGM
jgi:hypothetical protein